MRIENTHEDHQQRNFVRSDYGYAENVQDAMGILEERITSLGGTTVGYWATAGYDFNESKAMRDGWIVELAIDEDNQSDLTDSCIQAWVTQLKQEFGI